MKIDAKRRLQNLFLKLYVLFDKHLRKHDNEINEFKII